jgi:DNA-binding transcriptional MocR family regulator
MNVNTNTVLQALRELPHEGLLDFRRGHGVRVSGTPQRGAVIARARELLSFARRQGLSAREVDHAHPSAPLNRVSAGRPRTTHQQRQAAYRPHEATARDEKDPQRHLSSDSSTKAADGPRRLALQPDRAIA